MISCNAVENGNLHIFICKLSSNFLNRYILTANALPSPQKKKSVMREYSGILTRSHSRQKTSSLTKVAQTRSGPVPSQHRNTPYRVFTNPLLVK